MKKCLSLLLALVMVISLLPMTTFATTPMPKFRMCDPAYNTYLESYFNVSHTAYVVFEDVLDTDGVTVLGNKPVIAAETPTDNYIKYEFDGETAIITMKNIAYKRIAEADDFIHILKNNGDSYDNNFGVKFVLEGVNTIEGIDTHITLEAVGAIEITGSGSLTMNVTSSSNAVFWSKNAGDLLIKNTTLAINQTNGNTGTCGNIIANGAITVENANLTINCSKATAMITGTKYSTKLSDTTKGITFSQFSNVSINGGSITPVQTDGQITVNNSTVMIQKGTGNQSAFATSMPYLIGSFNSIELKKNGSYPNYEDASEYDIAEGTVLTTDYKMVGFKTTHRHIVKDCTLGSSICPCGSAFVEAEAKDHSFTNKAATKITDATCQAAATYYVQCDNCAVINDTLTVSVGNPIEHIPSEAEGAEHTFICDACGEDVTAALGHVPNTAAGDCTTVIVCKKCDYVFVEASEHTESTYDTNIIPATCTATGSKTVVTYCTVCQKTIRTERKTIPLIAHTETTNEQINKNATCVETGSKTVITYCSVCSKIISNVEEEIPVSDAHDYQNGVCTVCGKMMLWEYTITDGEVTITGYNGNETDILIPSTLEGLPVTTLGYDLFMDYENLTSVTIPYGITTIQSGAFAGTNLTSVIIPDSVTYIGGDTFRHCEYLTSVTLSKNVTFDGVATFSLSGLTSIVIPNGVTTITPQMFYNCTALTSIVLPNTITQIQEEAFYCCEGLSTVVYCGTQEQWDNIDIGDANGYLTGATLQFHNFENDICTLCGTTICTHQNTEKLAGYAASCTEDGMTDGEKCADCGEILVAQQPIPAAHTPGAEADCLNDQICTVCETILVAQLGHNYDANDVCTRCGAKIAPYIVEIKFYNDYYSDFTLSLRDGEVAYVEDTWNDELIRWTGAEAPINNFIKFEYIAAQPATLKVTMQNISVDQTEAGGYSCHGMEFLSGNYDIELELVGKNSMIHGKSACIKYSNNGTMTITGEGSLDLTINGAASGALWANGGDLLIKDTTMNFVVNPGNTSKHHAIFAARGSVTMENSTITSQTKGGQLIYFGTTDAKTGRYTMDEDTSRSIKIKNSEITASANANIFTSAAPATIISGNLILTLSSNGNIFSTVPVVEGCCTMLTGAAKYANTPDMLRKYDLKLNSYYTCIILSAEHLVTDCTTGTCECGETTVSTDGTHAFNKTPSGRVATAVTCTEPATYYIRCDHCYQYTTRKRITVGEPLGHMPEEDDGDCTTAVHCTLCDIIMTNARANHYEYRTTSTIYSPTCNDPGLMFVKVWCWYCDVILYEAYEEIPATGNHQGFIFTEDVVDPTCTEDGTKTISKCCSDCDTSVSTTVETIPATGHNYALVKTYTPSSTKKGYSLYTCETCGHSVKADFVTLVTGDLQEAINAAADGDTLRLNKNYKNASAITIPAGKNITIDLNGKYYSVGTVINGAALIVEEGAELTLIGASKLEVQANAAKQFEAVVKNAGKLTVKNVTLNANNLYANSFAIINSGDLTIGEGAVLKVVKATALSNTGTVANLSGAELEAAEGYHWTADGTLEAHDYSTVTGFAATCEKVSYDLHECACGASYEDNHGTKKLTVVAKIGTKLYASLQDAINAAVDGDTITLVKGIKDAKTVFVATGKKITIDMAGFYYAATEITNGAVIVIAEGAEVIIKNGKLQAEYAAWNMYDCVIRNSGKLTLENVTVNGNNLFKTGAATVINNGEITADANTVVTLNKNTNTECIGSPIVRQ